MKKQFIFLIGLLAFMPVSQLFAQPGTDCLNYPYILNISDFVCGNGEGQVCFEYEVAGWDQGNTFDDCADLIVEISYPTPNFIVTNIGDFTYDEDVSTGLSSLTLEPEVIFDAIWTECFEGLVQVPNTAFTLTIFYGSNPTEVYSVTTFTLDDVETVGTAGQTTLLSSLAVPGGPLLPPAQSDGNGQRIAVEGTLEVDVDYWFTSDFQNTGGQYGELIMMPGSRIEIWEGVTLHTSWLNIHGCDGTWDRMNLQPGITQNGAALDMGMRTVLKEATVGVEMNDETSFIFNDSEILECGIGMGAFGAAFKNINFLAINNPFANAISSFRSCNEGIHLENTSVLDLTPGLIGLQFYEMEDYAIYLEGTDLLANQIYISHCENGIWVEKPNNLVIIEDITCDGRGYKGRGLHTNGTTELRVIGGNFSNWGTGISRLTANANEYTLIENVRMSLCVHNIWGSVLPSSAEVQFNDLSAVSHNVWLSGIGSGEHQWAVQHNDALKSGTTPPDNMPSISFINRNIYFLSVVNGRIYKNDNTDPFFGFNTFSSPLTNIHVSGGEYATIGENNPSVLFSPQRNMEIWGSPLANIYCNNTTGASTSFLVMNDCAGSEIRANDFSGAWGSFNLLYGSQSNQNATTGVQYKMGNRFDLSTASTPKAKHFAPLGIAAASQYIVGLFTPDPSVPGGTSFNVQGNATFPFFTSLFPQWFLKDFNGIDNANCIPGLAEEVRLENAVRTRIDLLGDSIGAVFGEEVEFDTELKLYRHLNRLQNLTTLDEDLDLLHTSMSSTDLAKFIEFEDMYREAVGLTETEASQKEQLSLDIETLKGDMTEIEWLIVDPVTGEVSIDPTEKAVYDAKLALMGQKANALSSLVESKQTALIGILGNLSNVNNSIGTQATVSGQNLKMVNGLLLQRYAPGFAGFSEADVTQLTLIAEQCVGEGGEGVYIARSLLAEHLKEPVEYEDECIEELGSRGSFANSDVAPVTSKLEIMPNPADDITMVALPIGHSLAHLALVDAFGRTVQVFNIGPEQMSLDINTSGLNAGVYFLVPSDKEESPVRFTIVH